MSFSVQTIVSFSFFLLCYLPFYCASQDCYWPNSSFSGSMVPCFNGTKPSACCGYQQDGSLAYCMTNNLCLGDNSVYRGSCTDREWKSSSCPQYCTDGEYTQLSAVETTCSNGSFISGDHSWTITALTNCGMNVKSCSLNCSSTYTFGVPVGQVMLKPEQAADLGLYNTTVTVSPAIPSPTSALPPVSSSPPTTVLTSNDSEPSNVCCPGKGSNSKAIAVGAGAGALFAVAFLTTLGLLIRQRRKTASVRENKNASTVSSPTLQQLPEEPHEVPPNNINNELATNTNIQELAAAPNSHLCI